MNCDKCGKPVPENNDAVMLDFLATNNWLLLIDSQSRHLFPTESCEGSPAIVKAIESNHEYQKAYEILKRRSVTNDKDAQK